MKKRLLVVLLAGAVLAAGAVSAQAQSYPSKPIRIIVPFNPGGGTDTFGRAIAQKMQERFGQTVVVENKPGAGGNIGADLVAKSAPDGYTLLLAQDSLTIVPYLYKSLPFNVIRDFAPIGIGVFMPMVLVVANDLPVKSVNELIAYAKANPGKLSYATPGIGTAHHLNFETFLTRTETKMVHVPYKGATEMMPGLISGDVHVGLSALSTTSPLIKAGRIRAIGVADPERVPQFKDLPTVSESLPGYVASAWFGLAAPAGTPEAITNKLSEELRAILKLPDTHERLSGMGYKIKPTTPAEMRDLMASEYGKWGKVIKAAGIQPE